MIAVNQPNLILNTDSYKVCHWALLPPESEIINAYVESRGGAFDRALFSGIQPVLMAYLARRITMDDVLEAELILRARNEPFNRKGWEYIVRVHGGRLPLEIEALPEGTVARTGNVLVQIRNTDPMVPWLVTYIETVILRAVWYMTTVATLSRAAKDLIRPYLAETADTLDKLPIMLHDFGARGATCEEQAMLGGAAHLINFVGTDTLSGVLGARRFYALEDLGKGVPAAEHTTIISWGRENEEKAYENALNKFGRAIVSVVSDSYDLFNAIDNIWGGSLKEKVETMGGLLVVRPDSGKPEEIVPETIDRLMARFGETRNGKGYRVLPECVRVIQGDGVTMESIPRILEAMKARKQSADNIVFGMGGGLLQKVDRDTMKFAMKASAIKVNGVWKDICKDPITDPGKKSKEGVLAAVRDSDGEVITVREADRNGRDNLLRTVFRNGEILVKDDFQAIRARADGQIDEIRVRDPEILAA